MKINTIEVGVKNGNIATEAADCIVVPEFENCASRGGVGYAIEAAGMAEGLDAYDAIVERQARQFGDAIITPSGKPGVAIAHVATAGADEEKQFGVVNTAVYKTLVAAAAHGLSHVALPELGTGIIGSLTQEQSAKSIFNAVHRFSTEHPSSSVRNVSLIIFRGSTTPAEKVLAEKSYIDLNAEKGKKPIDSHKVLAEVISMLARNPK